MRGRWESLLLLDVIQMWGQESRFPGKAGAQKTGRGLTTCPMSQAESGEENLFSDISSWIR